MQRKDESLREERRRNRLTSIVFFFYLDYIDFFYSFKEESVLKAAINKRIFTNALIILIA